MSRLSSVCIDLGRPHYFENFRSAIISALAGKLTIGELGFVTNTLANRMKKGEIFGNCIAGAAVSLDAHPSYDWEFGHYFDKVDLHSGKTVYLTIIYE